MSEILKQTSQTPEIPLEDEYIVPEAKPVDTDSFFEDEGYVVNESLAADSTEVNQAPDFVDAKLAAGKEAELNIADYVVPGVRMLGGAAITLEEQRSKSDYAKAA